MEKNLLLFKVGKFLLFLFGIVDEDDFIVIRNNI